MTVLFHSWLFWVIYIISAAAIEFILFREITHSPLNSSDINFAIGTFIIGFIPLINTFFIVLFIVIICGELFKKWLINFSHKSVDKRKEKQKSLQKKYEDVKKALVIRGLIQNKNEIDDFVESSFLMETLANTKEGEGNDSN